MKIVHVTLSRRNGIGQLKCSGYRTFRVGGKADFDYPNDVVVQIKDKSPLLHNAVFNMEMPLAVPWDARRGLYIHQAEKLDGSPGPLRLYNKEAEKFYNWLGDDDGQLRIIFKWAGRNEL